MNHIFFLCKWMLLALLVTSCAGIESRRGRQSGGQQPFEADRPKGSQPGYSEEDETYQSPIKTPVTRKVAVVFGPGAYKTFAYPSFIKAFVQTGVPVEKVVGIEWGSLSAAFFALNGKAHEAEWKLFKLKEDQLETKSFFGSSKAQSVSSLKAYLQENLGDKQTTETRVGFQCPLLDLGSGSVDWEAREPLWQRVESCLASVPKHSPAREFAPSSLSLGQVAKNLRRQGFGIVVLVNVLGRGRLLDKKADWSDRLYWQEVRRQLWAAKAFYSDVYDIDTDEYELFDSKAKKGLRSKGEAVGRKAAKDIIGKYDL